MGMTSQLDVVNNCLATMGETGVNEVTDDHPFIGDALRYFRLTNQRLQGREGGWWFNREWMTLAPDADSGFIYVPGDTINVYAIDSRDRLAYRDRRLYDRYTQSYVFTDSVYVGLTRLVPFDDLPQMAADVVDYETQLAFMVQYDADSQRYQQTQRALDIATRDLKAEEIRNEGTNLLNQGTMALKLQNIGPRLGRRLSNNLFFSGPFGPMT